MNSIIVDADIENVDAGSNHPLSIPFFEITAIFIFFPFSFYVAVISAFQFRMETQLKLFPTHGKIYVIGKRCYIYKNLLSVHLLQITNSMIHVRYGGYTQ